MPYKLYVIELSPAVILEHRFAAKNPGRRSDKPCVYVGSTAHEPEVRFQQHKAGYKANRYAYEFGVRLRPRLVARYEPFPTRAAAEMAEALLAERLRKRGYAVWSG